MGTLTLFGRFLQGTYRHSGSTGSTQNVAQRQTFYREKEKEKEKEREGERERERERDLYLNSEFLSILQLFYKKAE